MVSLSQNSFFGQLPQNLSKLSPLEHLDLRDTNLTSEFPAFLSQLSSLQVLNIRNTALEGSITDDLLNLGSLHILDLSNNNLTGKIPSSFGNLAGMTDTPSTLSTLPEIFTIPVVCSEDVQPPTDSVLEEMEKEEIRISSWKAMAIGYPFDFSSATIVTYVIV
ncbi:hypothetical protein WN944_003137 [Citrus x changshan-huyou]|uniref:Uncharacterized protein n=2 Tax=Citrus TaxID=2706 RepID=A0ACB8JMQ4_CITSI|nr:hypothetical protein KPL71_017163 [Citrus sinensis]